MFNNHMIDHFENIKKIIFLLFITYCIYGYLFVIKQSCCVWKKASTKYILFLLIGLLVFQNNNLLSLQHFYNL